VLPCLADGGPVENNWHIHVHIHKFVTHEQRAILEQRHSILESHVVHFVPLIGILRSATVPILNVTNCCSNHATRQPWHRDAKIDGLIGIQAVHFFALDHVLDIFDAHGNINVLVKNSVVIMAKNDLDTHEKLVCFRVVAERSCPIIAHVFVVIVPRSVVSVRGTGARHFVDRVDAAVASFHICERVRITFV